MFLDSTGALYQKGVPADHLKIISIPDAWMDQEESYEVEAILDHRGRTWTREYFGVERL